MWVSITWLWGSLHAAKRGAEGGSGLDLRRACRARTGHKYILSSRGSWIM